MITLTNAGTNYYLETQKDRHQHVDVCVKFSREVKSSSQTVVLGNLTLF